MTVPPGMWKYRLFLRSRGGWHGLKRAFLAVGIGRSSGRVGEARGAVPCPISTVGFFFVGVGNQERPEFPSGGSGVKTYMAG